MRLTQHRQFEKKLLKLPKPLKIALTKRLELFVEDSRNPLLRDHALTGDRDGQRSINVTGDLRLIYQRIDAETILLLDLDTHHNLYGS